MGLKLKGKLSRKKNLTVIKFDYDGRYPWSHLNEPSVEAFLICQTKKGLCYGVNGTLFSRLWFLVIA